MRTTDWDAILDAAVSAARSYLATLEERRVHPDAGLEETRAAVSQLLTDTGEPADEVVADLARRLDPHIAAHASGRYFGFVIGGLHPAAYGAEILAATWDQNAGLYAPTPGVTVVEEVAARWIVELARLPEECSVGFVTGGQMATFTCLAAARDDVLRSAGWDVGADGLQGAPKVTVVVKAGRHATVPRALRFLGLGERAEEVACDDQDRMLVADLAETLERITGPTIVCVEAGNVNTGAFDFFDDVADLVEAHRDEGSPTWVHVDGAVGLLARSSPSFAHLTAGAHRLDSWSTDAHKLLNVAYDCGIAITRHPAAHRASMSVRAGYLIQGDGQVREPMDFNPEFSRRARGLGVYATLRSLGRDGVAALPERLTGLAQRFAAGLQDSGVARVCNEVVFNQVLVDWVPPAEVELDDDGLDAFNDEIVEAIQRDGTAFVSGTTWRSRRMMRISVSNWTTDEQDVDRTVEVMLRCAQAAVAARR